MRVSEACLGKACLLSGWCWQAYWHAQNTVNSNPTQTRPKLACL